MVSRASSPVLIGRDGEVEALRTALNRPATDPRRIVLVEGEAGIGKTRFILECARDFSVASEPEQAIRFVWGRCVQLTEGALPYGPIVEVLDELAQDEHEPTSPAIARLRDLMSGAIEETTPSSSESRGRLFLELRHALVAAAGGRPLVVVIDDAHWADRSTLDLIAYLSNRLGGTPLLLLLAYRSDEIARRHPMKPLLAELQRGRTLDRITLEALDPASATRQIGAIVQGEVDPSFAKRVIHLADGNPFHIEELVALGGSWSSLPGSLRDVSLARLERLDRPVIDVIRDAGVIGREVDAELLSVVSGRPEVELREALRAAVDEFIFVPSDDGHRYRFRHALLREAVYEDLLPADRVQLHRRVADALAADLAANGRPSAVAAAELARHRDAAQQTDLAREAYRDAGELALRAQAWSEAAGAFQRVLELDAAGDERSDPVDLPFVRSAARALWFAGRPHQAEDLLASALTRLNDRGDPMALASAWLELGVIRNDMGKHVESKVAGSRARAVAPRQPANGVRVRAMGDLASTFMIEGHHRKAIRLANCVIAMADRIGATDVRAEARAQRGPALMAIGLADAARRDLDDGRRIAAENGDILALGIVLYNGGASFGAVGAFEEGLALVLEASAIAGDLGLEESWDPWLLSMAAAYAYWLGRWEDADRYVAGARLHEMDGTPLLVAAAQEGILAAHRGNDRRASELFAEAAAAEAPGELAGWWRAMQARAHLMASESGLAIAIVDEAIEILSLTDDLAIRALLAALGAEAAADLAEQRRARRDSTAAATWAKRAREFAQLAADIDSGNLIRGSQSSPLTLAHLAHAQAHARRAPDSGDPASWVAATTAFDVIGARPTAAWTRYRLAEAQLAVGDHAQARDALRDARTIALEVGDAALLALVDGLARRGRLEVHAAEATAAEPVLTPGVVPAARPANPWKLSLREIDVLTLVADGLTNREIARQLFITEKTASSHVTHILDKLGVASRTEAALIAVKAGGLALSAGSDSPAASSTMADQALIPPRG